MFLWEEHSSSQIYFYDQLRTRRGTHSIWWPRSIKVSLMVAIFVPLGVSEMPVNFEAGGGLHVHTDSSWGNSAKPFGGYIIMLHNGPVDWSSKKLRIVADSTCEAETAPASRAVKPLLFIRELLNTMGVPTRGATLFMVENQAMMQMDGSEGRHDIAHAVF